jgi:4-hydroxy-2-oxoheptanedioate aldolase
MGIIVPMVKTVEEAEAVVAATRYPPDGNRGFGPLRASRYTLDYDDYLERANRNILVGLLVETAEAVGDLERIARVPGVDLLYMGLWDLSLALGADPRKQPNPETDAVIKNALKVGRDTGVAMGIGVGSPEDLAHRLDQGFTFLGYGSDYNLLVAGAKAAVEAFQASQSEEAKHR